MSHNSPDPYHAPERVLAIIAENQRLKAELAKDRDTLVTLLHAASDVCYNPEPRRGAALVVLHRLLFRLVEQERLVERLAPKKAGAPT